MPFKPRWAVLLKHDPGEGLPTWSFLLSGTCHFLLLLNPASFFIFLLLLISSLKIICLFFHVCLFVYMCSYVSLCMCVCLSLCVYVCICACVHVCAHHCMSVEAGVSSLILQCGIRLRSSGKFFYLLNHLTASPSLRTPFLFFILSSPLISVCDVGTRSQPSQECALCPGGEEMKQTFLL